MTVIAVQKVWVQTSADYDAAERTRTLIVKPETTVEELMRWANRANVLGSGDVYLTESEELQ